jgi:hypothetical protein
VLGSVGFIDFVQLRAELGEERAIAETRQCMEEALKGKTVQCD